jgi:hypothetical protein
MAHLPRVGNGHADQVGHFNLARAAIFRADLHTGIIPRGDEVSTFLICRNQVVRRPVTDRGRTVGYGTLAEPPICTPTGPCLRYAGRVQIWVIGVAAGAPGTR